MEIKKNRWSHFCKMFSSTNQYRPAIISAKSYESSDEYDVSRESLFTGMQLKKKGRQISSVELFCSQPHPDRLLEPVISIEKPVEIAVRQDDDGEDKWLTIEGEDGTWASIIFSGPVDQDQCHAYTEMLAYAFGERRDFVPGGDLDDWFKAETILKEAELRFR